MSEQAKAIKDLRQAGDLLEVLLEDRPGDLPPAWEEVTHNPAVVKTVRRAIGRLAPGIQEGLERALPGSAASIR